MEDDEEIESADEGDMVDRIMNWIRRSDNNEEVENNDEDENMNVTSDDEDVVDLLGGDNNVFVFAPPFVGMNIHSSLINTT